MRSLQAAGANVTRRCLEQTRGHRYDQQRRDEWDGRQFMRMSGQCHPGCGPLFLRQKLGLRDRMRDRILPFVERDLVLQTPSKYGRRKHEKAQRKQENATA
jgi:hypothetical protein